MELVKNQKSLGFLNRLFWSQNLKTHPRHQQSTAILQARKVQTGGKIRTSLHAGEWVTSIDFSNAYFHIPIENQSRKYVRFHIQGQTYRFKALPFGLSTTPIEFKVVAKEDGFTQGYKNLPAPRCLVGKNQIPPSMSPAYTNSSSNFQEVHWLVNMQNMDPNI